MQTYCTQIPSMLPTRPIDAYSLKAMSILKNGVDYFKVTESQLRSPSRERRIVWPRHIICHVLRSYDRVTLKQLGKMMGNRDHTTIVNSMKMASALHTTDPEFQKMYNGFIGQLAFNKIIF